MESDKCKILWDFIVKTDREIYGWYLRIRKNRTLPRFGMRVEKYMEHVSQGYTTTDRCSKSNTNKVKKLVKENR